ncbi:helix-turn-helix domain-containing protein [Micromonospora schwarzwaldensis]
MAERWAIERAVRDAECPLGPSGRHLILTLLTWSDHSTAVIPAQFSLSLTDLERATGMARSTIAVWLNELEELGWVVRHRPKVDEARSKKAKANLSTANSITAADWSDHRTSASPTAEQAWSDHRTEFKH